MRSKRESVRKWQLHKGALALVCTLWLLAPTAAAAVPGSAGGFSDGSERADFAVSAPGVEVGGAALRLPANATITSASLVLSGAGTFTNSTIQESTTGDFASNTLMQGVVASAGSLSLAHASGVTVLDASNLFGNATLSTAEIVGGVARIQWPAVDGTVTTQPLAAPAGGWGILVVSAAGPPGAALSFAVLDLGGLEIRSSVLPGTAVGVDAVAYPSVVLRADLTANATGVSPTIGWLSLGQQAGDTLYGGAVQRTLTNARIGPSGGVTINASTSLIKYAGNPILSPVVSSWYSSAIGHPFLLEVGQSYWLYFLGANTPTGPRSIGRAVSTDLRNWTIGSAPVLNGTAGQWDEGGVTRPYVMQNPAGGGYVMFYDGNNATLGPRLGRATSPDGVTWTKAVSNPVLTTTAAAWDSYMVGSVTRIAFAAGTWTMWYYGGSASSGAYERDLGVATSTNGIAWTKYGSNPVMQNNDPFDSADMSYGSTVDFEGKLRMYYACNDGSAYSICEADTTDGYSWTKVGVVVPHAGSGWDREAHDAAGIVVGGALVMFYEGLDTVEQIGRIDSKWQAGTLQGTVDFGADAPVSLDRLTMNATVPPAASVQVTLSSSADGLSWSSPEALAGGGVVFTTPAARYVRWNVTMNSSLGAAAPTVWSALLTFSSLSPSGRYESSPFNGTDAVTAVTVTVAGVLTPGAVAVDVTTDRGATWMRVLSGGRAAVTGSGTSLGYALSFEGTTSAGPLVDSVTLLVERGAWPENVSVRVEGGSISVATSAGALQNPTNVTLSVAALNAAIADAVAASPGSPTVDLPLVVNASRAGTVTLSAPRVAYTTPGPPANTAPSVTSTAPQGPVTMTQGAAASFTVVALDNEGDALTYAWFVDGGTVAGATATLTTSFPTAATHTLRVDVSDPTHTVSASWSVTVVAGPVNAAPTVTSFSPQASAAAVALATTTFTINAVDLDGDTISYAWFVDGASVVGASPQLIVSFPTAGTHTVRADISDGSHTVSTSWTVAVTVGAVNRPPFVTSSAPSATITLQPGGAQIFEVLASDPEGGALTYAWFVDGAAHAGSSAQLNLSFSAVGAHTVKVQVSDGTNTNETSWTVNVAGVPTTTPPGGDFTLLLALGLGAAVVVAAIAMLMMKRKKTG